MSKTPKSEVASRETHEKPAESSTSEERRFLHDLSNPLAVAAGLIETLLDETQAGDVVTEPTIRRLARAHKSLEKIRDLMHARRQEILAKESSPSNSKKTADDGHRDSA